MSRARWMMRGVLAAAALALAPSAWAQSYVHATYLLSSAQVCTNAGCTPEYGTQAANHASSSGFPQAVGEYCLNWNGNFYQCNPESAALDLLFKWTDVYGLSWKNEYSAGTMYPYPTYPYVTPRGTNGQPASAGVSIGNNQPRQGQYGAMWMACAEQDAFTWTCYYGTGGPGWFWSINFYYTWQWNNWYPWF